MGTMIFIGHECVKIPLLKKSNSKIYQIYLILDWAEMNNQ